MAEIHSRHKQKWTFRHLLGRTHDLASCLLDFLVILFCTALCIPLIAFAALFCLFSTLTTNLVDRFRRDCPVHKQRFHYEILEKADATSHRRRYCPTCRVEEQEAQEQARQRQERKRREYERERAEERERLLALMETPEIIAAARRELEAMERGLGLVYESVEQVSDETTGNQKTKTGDL